MSRMIPLNVIIKLSPLFSVTTDPNHQSVRVGLVTPLTMTDSPDQFGVVPSNVLQGSAGRGSLSPVLRTTYTTYPVSSIEEAEDKLMSIATNMDVQEPHHISQEVDSMWLLVINRAANLIAARTRRDKGNVVLMHPDLWKVISKLDTGWTYEIKENFKEIGRWTQVCYKFNGNMSVFISDCINHNEVMVLYRNNPIYSDKLVLDGPAILLLNKNSFNLMCLANDPSALGSAQDYIVRIRLTESCHNIV